MITPHSFDFQPAAPHVRPKSAPLDGRNKGACPLGAREGPIVPQDPLGGLNGLPKHENGSAPFLIEAQKAGEPLSGPARPYEVGPTTPLSKKSIGYEDLRSAQPARTKGSAPHHQAYVCLIDLKAGLSTALAKLKQQYGISNLPPQEFYPLASEPPSALLHAGLRGPGDSASRLKTQLRLRSSGQIRRLGRFGRWRMSLRRRLTGSVPAAPTASDLKRWNRWKDQWSNGLLRKIETFAQKNPALQEPLKQFQSILFQEPLTLGELLRALEALENAISHFPLF